VDYPTISFTDDGFALFDAVNNYAGSPWTNQNIPDAAKPNAVVAPLWQDMEIVYDLATNKGVSIATAGSGVHIIEYDDVQIWGEPTKTYDVEIVYYHVVDDTPNYYEIVFAYDNINGPLNGATIGVENVGGTVATPYAYNNASFANGHMVCFDLVTPSATRTITFQVTVDMDADFGPLTNEALHDNNALGTMVEAAKAVVEISRAPVAVADAYTTAEDTVLVVAAPGVLANDSDADLDTLTAVLVDNVTNGTLALASDGSFTYTPSLDFFGQDGFTYKAFDGGHYSEVVTVTLTVTPVNDAPMAVDDAYSVVENTLLTVAAPGVMANDVEVDADNMVVTLVSNVAHGKLVLLGDGSFTYQPAPDFFGTDTFVYRLITYPAIQSMWTDEATVTITVTEEIPVVFNLYLPMIIK
jgi:hypothetical protein